MATILITGGTGFIGSRLIPALAKEHQAISFARSPSGEGPAIVAEGSFLSDGDLSRLDDFDIDVAIHLAAVKAHCSEEDGMQVNVVGSRRLVRYLLDRGCRRFILASTIAVPGCWNPEWIPDTLPIPADHVCQARDAYGMSKWLMEQEAEYFARCTPDAGFVLPRLAHVRDDETWHSELIPTDGIQWPWLDLADVMLSDVLDAFGKAIDKTNEPGVHRYNIAGPDVRTQEPVAAALTKFFGANAEQLDLDHHEEPGNEFAPVYDLRPARDDLGWTPKRSTRSAAD